MNIMGKVTAIVLAAGKGNRMHSEIPKQYLEVYNKPILYYALHASERYLHQKTKLIQGDYSNIKVTTPDDLDAVLNFFKKNKKSC